MRPLTLHVSALSDAEYDLYTASLNDLATESTNGDTTPNTIRVRDDAHYERTSVGVREVRAWLRGRYSNLPATDIDSVSLGSHLHHVSTTDTSFSPNMCIDPQVVLSPHAAFRQAHRRPIFCCSSPRYTRRVG